jgi:hypothetical protein
VLIPVNLVKSLSVYFNGLGTPSRILGVADVRNLIVMKKEPDPFDLLVPLTRDDFAIAISVFSSHFDINFG